MTKNKTGSFKILNALEILDANDLVMEFVPTPEWSKNADPDTGVYVRNMTAEARDQWEYEQVNWDVPVMISDPNDPKHKKEILNPERRSKDWTLTFRARLASLCCCDENGERIFSDDQVHALARKNVKPLIRIANKATELSSISDEDIEKLSKNSEDGRTEDSPID